MSHCSSSLWQKYPSPILTSNLILHDSLTDIRLINTLDTQSVSYTNVSSTSKCECIVCEWACRAWYVSVSRTPPPEFSEAFQEPHDIGEFCAIIFARITKRYKSWRNKYEFYYNNIWILFCGCSNINITRKKNSVKSFKDWRKIYLKMWRNFLLKIY